MTSYARLFTVLIATLAVSNLAAVCGSKPLQPEITITSPVNGSFTEAGSVLVTGVITDVIPGTEIVTVNDVVVPVTAGAFSTTVTLDPAIIFNPIMAELDVTSNGKHRADRVVLVVGPSVVDGDFEDDSIALRLNDSGLDQVEPLVETLAGGALDFESFLIAANPVATMFQCIIPNPFGGCITGITITVDVETADIGGFTLDVDSMTNFAAGDIAVSDILVTYDTDGIDCQGRITATSADILGDYALQADAVDPSSIDVNLDNASLDVTFSSFNNEFTGGLCDFPLIGPLISLIIGNVEPLVDDGITSSLQDPDGSGPLDSPIADGIETALAGISITGPIGEALGVTLEAPLFDVLEDTAGITLGSDGRMVANIGTGVGQCDAPASAPDLPASYAEAETFPSFGATTPVGGLPYDLGICVSTGVFNQLLKAEIECGLLQTELTEFDFGFGPVPVTAGTLALFLPDFAQLHPDEPMVIRVTPNLAPVVTSDPGPQGEIAGLRLGGLDVSLVIRAGLPNEILALRASVDLLAGLDLAFTAGQLVPTIASVDAGDLTVALVDNPLEVNGAQVETVLGLLLPVVLPSLGDGLGAFPLPAFLGLELDGVEVSRNGEFLSIFADLNTVP